MPCDIALFSKQARPLADSPSIVGAEESRGVEPQRSPVRPFSRRRRPRAGLLSLLARRKRESSNPTPMSSGAHRFPGGPGASPVSLP